jgi:Cys-tRNA(Pro)/Cys-tRNA(Cys) deacylase
MTPAINLLKKLKIPYKLYPYECEAHDDFGKHAATQLDLPEAQVFKTLVAHHDKQAVVAIVPSSGMCSLKHLAKAAGLKKVEMMKPAEAEKLTGYKVGGISPLAQKKLLPTVLDDSAMQFDEILVSGGKRGLSVGVSPREMQEKMDWLIAAIGE